MTAQLAPAPVFRSWDNNGLPLFLGKLFTYAAGTTTLQATYTDSTQTTQNPNPVILNIRGEAFVWLNRAYQERSYLLTYLTVDERLDNLHSDPRFDELRRRVGLPTPK